MNITMKNGRVCIDGRDFTGKSISISGNQVIVDGVPQDGTLAGPITVNVVGDVESLTTGSGDVYILGKVGQVRTGSGDV